MKEGQKSLFSPGYDKFLKYLKQARIDAGLTQVEASRLLKREQSFLSKCERGERRVDVVELIAFCRAYGIEPAEFVSKL